MPTPSSPRRPGARSRAMLAAGLAAAAVGLYVTLALAFQDGESQRIAAASGAASGRGATPATAILSEVSAASADVAARVRPSVVFITATGQVEDMLTLADAEGGVEIPPELYPLLRGLPGVPHLPPRRERDPRFRDPRFRDPRFRAVSSGSGVIVSADGYVLTNRHVVSGARRVTVRLLDRRELTARVVGTDAATDIAVLKVDALGLAAAALGNSDSSRVGEWVVAIGNPLGDALTFSVTAGIVSAKGRALDLPGTSRTSIQDFIQTDAPINPGSSGGPLVNVAGEVIGINSAIASPTGSYAGYGFAVPINLARVVMRQLVAGGRVERVGLGVGIRDASAEDAQYVGLDTIRGVLVQDVAGAESPAARAGMRAGDVIVAVDGRPVDHVADLQEAVTFRRAGDVVALEVARRGGQHAVLRVALRAIPGDSAAPRPPREADESRPGDATTPALGVRVVPTDPRAVRELRLPEDVRGLVVVDVDEDGPAAGRLATPDDGGPDVLLSVEDRPVRTAAELRDALRRAGPGGVVTLALYNVPARERRVERVRLAPLAPGG